MSSGEPGARLGVSIPPEHSQRGGRAVGGGVEGARSTGRLRFPRRRPVPNVNRPVPNQASQTNVAGSTTSNTSRSAGCRSTSNYTEGMRQTSPAPPLRRRPIRMFRSPGNRRPLRQLSAPACGLLVPARPPVPAPPPAPTFVTIRAGLAAVERANHNVRRALAGAVAEHLQRAAVLRGRAMNVSSSNMSEHPCGKPIAPATARPRQGGELAASCGQQQPAPLWPDPAPCRSVGTLWAAGASGGLGEWGWGGRRC